MRMSVLVVFCLGLVQLAQASAESTKQGQKLVPFRVVIENGNGCEVEALSANGHEIFRHGAPAELAAGTAYFVRAWGSKTHHGQRTFGIVPDTGVNLVVSLVPVLKSKVSFAANVPCSVLIGGIKADLANGTGAAEILPGTYTLKAYSRLSGYGRAISYQVKISEGRDTTLSFALPEIENGKSELALTFEDCSLRVDDAQGNNVFTYAASFCGCPITVDTVVTLLPGTYSVYRGNSGKAASIVNLAEGKTLQLAF